MPLILLKIVTLIRAMTGMKNDRNSLITVFLMDRNGKGERKKHDVIQNESFAFSKHAIFATSSLVVERAEVFVTTLLYNFTHRSM